MFTAQALQNGSTYLSEHLSANDYYAEGEQVVGEWIGRGADMLGLAGVKIGPKDAAFEALRTNRHPETGKKLTARESKTRRAMYDFQCSAPKSVSVMAVTYGDTRLVDAHREAVRAAFRELEQYAARQDNHTGKGRQTIITGNVVAAEFCHDASRELEAQLHTHLVAMNLTRDASGEWFALENSEMYRAIALAGRAYQADMAQRVQALGYEIREDRNEKGVVQGFEIKGVTADDCARQSTRRAQIEAAIERFRAEKGRAPSTREIHVITTETRRDKKLREITTPEVRAGQLAKYSSEDRERLTRVRTDAQARAGLRMGPPTREAREIIALAIEHCTERNAVVTRADVLTYALQENLGHATLADLRASLNQSPDAVSLTNDAALPYGSQKITSRTQLERERVSINLIQSQRGALAALGTPEQIAPQLRSDEKAADQRAAVERIITSRDAVNVMLGRAGTGKTYTIKEIARIAKEAGVEMEFCAPSHKAKGLLQQDGFQAETVSMTLIQVKRGEKSLKGKMLVVDEAGMLSTRQGAELLQAAKDAGARVLLVGDDRQLLSVESGDWLNLVLKQNVVQPAELSRIRRQLDQDYKDTAKLLSEGRARDAYEQLDQRGLVHAEGSNYLNTAADKFLEHRQAGRGVVMVAPTWAEIDRLNEQVRAALTKSGELRGPETMRPTMDTADLTAAQRRVIGNYRPGEYVRATQRVRGVSREEWARIDDADQRTGKITLSTGAKINVREHGAELQIARQVQLGIRAGDTLLLTDTNRKLGVTNGDRVAVVGIDDNGAIQAKHDKRTITLPPTYTGMVHGYAVTVEKSQGDTQTATIAAGANWDARRLYVAVTRARQFADVYVPDREHARNQLPNRITGKEHALDHVAVAKMAPTPKAPQRSPVMPPPVQRPQLLARWYAQVVRAWERATHALTHTHAPERAQTPAHERGRSR